MFWDKHSKTKKLVVVDYAAIDEAVYQCLHSQRSQLTPVNGRLLREKALHYTKELEFPKRLMVGRKTGIKGDTLL